MPLSAVNFVPLTGNIKAVDHQQFFDLFTGVMTDQPVTFANTLRVGGSQAVGSAVFRVNGVALQTGNMVELRVLGADAQPVFSIDKAGKVSWGPGGGVGTDVSLQRVSASNLRVTGALTLDTVGGVGLIVGTGSGAGAIRLANALSVNWRNGAGTNDHAILFNGADQFLIQFALTTQFTFSAGPALVIGTGSGAGTIRLPNNTSINWRNSAGTNDHALFVDGADNINIQLNLGTKAHVRGSDGALVVDAGIFYPQTDTLAASAGNIRLRSGDLIGWRNAANTANVVLGFDGADRLAITGITTTAGATAGGGSAIPATTLGFLRLNLGGTEVKVPYYAA